MPAQTWGMLPKSQVDDETVEEAIDRLIQAHDDDEAAHLEVGQSLQSHKASEIIDHEALSVVPDKISRGFFSNQSIVGGWQSLDAFGNYGAGATLQFDQIVMQSPASLGSYNGVYAKGNSNFLDSPVIEFYAAFIFGGGTNKGQCYVGIGDGWKAEDTGFLGFKVVDGTIYGCISYNYGGTEHLLNLGSVSDGQFRLLRAEYEVGVGAHFFIEGVAVGDLLYTDLDELGGWLFVCACAATQLSRYIQALIKPFYYAKNV